MKVGNNDIADTLIATASYNQFRVMNINHAIDIHNCFE